MDPAIMTTDGARDFEEVLADIRLFRHTASTEGFDALLQEAREALGAMPQPRVKRSPESPDPEDSPELGGPWLYRSNGKARAHIWTGNDTVCRMAKTGGLGRNWLKRYGVHEDRGTHEICGNCANLAAGLPAVPNWYG